MSLTIVAIMQFFPGTVCCGCHRTLTGSTGNLRNMKMIKCHYWITSSIGFGLNFLAYSFTPGIFISPSQN